MIRLKEQLAKEDLEQQRAGVIFLHELSPSGFIQSALKVEASQYVHVDDLTRCSK